MRQSFFTKSFSQIVTIFVAIFRGVFRYHEGFGMVAPNLQDDQFEVTRYNWQFDTLSG